MRHRHDSAVTRYLAAHAAMGALLGAAMATALLCTGILGLQPLVARDPMALILIPALAGLFAEAAGATALALLVAAGEEGMTRREPASWRPVAVQRVPVRR